MSINMVFNDMYSIWKNSTRETDSKQIVNLNKPIQSDNIYYKGQISLRYRQMEELVTSLNFQQSVEYHTYWKVTLITHYFRTCITYWLPINIESLTKRKTTNIEYL